MPSTAELVCVDPKRVHEVWPYVVHLLQRAVDQCGDWSIGEIAAAIDNGALLWFTFDGTFKAAAVTRLIFSKGELVCQAIACGGADEDWPATFLQIEEYAKREGCKKCRISGRPGWARVFKEYKIELVTLEKELA